MYGPVMTASFWSSQCHEITATMFSCLRPAQGQDINIPAWMGLMCFCRRFSDLGRETHNTRFSTDTNEQAVMPTGRTPWSRSSPGEVILRGTHHLPPGFSNERFQKVWDRSPYVCSVSLSGRPQLLSPLLQKGSKE